MDQVQGIVQPFVDVAVWFVEGLATIAQYAVAGWIGKI